MKGASVNINIFMLKINSFENASAVNIGQNLLADWNNSDKKSQGYGKILVMKALLLAHKAL